MSIEKGKRYESKQDPGRVVRVKWPAFNPPQPRTATSDPERRRWVVEVIANPSNPKTVGRRTTVTGKTLLGRYRELSH